MSHRYQGLSRGRIATRGQMNKTESKYAHELEVLRRAGEIERWWFEPFSLRLSSPSEGQPARYTPDFMVLMPDGITYMDDVKGSGVDNDAAAVRAKTAAELYPLWIFRIVKLQTQKQGGGWKVTVV